MREVPGSIPGMPLTFLITKGASKFKTLIIMCDSFKLSNAWMSAFALLVVVVRSARAAVSAAAESEPSAVGSLEPAGCSTGLSSFHSLRLRGRSCS